MESVFAPVFKLERYLLPKEERDRLEREEKVEKNYQDLQNELIHFRQKVAQAIANQSCVEEHLSDVPSQVDVRQSRLDKLKCETTKLRQKLAELEARVQKCYTEKQMFLAASKGESAQARAKQATLKFEESLAKMRQTESEFCAKSGPSSEPHTSSVRFDVLLEKYGRLVWNQEEYADTGKERAVQSEENAEFLASEISELTELFNSFSVWSQEVAEAIDETVEHKTALQKRIDALISECKTLDETSDMAGPLSSRDKVKHQAEVHLRQELVKIMIEERDKLSAATEILRKAFGYLKVMLSEIDARLTALKSSQ